MAQNQTPTQALAKYNPGEFNIVLPVTQVDNLPVGTQVSVRVVKLDANSKDDVYSVEGKRALTKNALNKIATAAGVSWKSVERTDDRKHPHYCEFMARAVVTDFDGTVREGIGTKTIDLREDTGDGTPGKDYRAMVVAAGDKRDPRRQIDKAREFIAEFCASKAMNRAISTVLAIKRSYSDDELKHPFVVPKLIPDTNDPTAKAMVMGSMFGVASEALYGRPPGQVIEATLAPAEVIEAAPEDEDEAMNYDPETGEVLEEAPVMGALDQAQAMRRVTKAWNVAKSRGATRETWLALMLEHTGKKNYDGITEAQLVALEKAAGV